MYFFAIIHEHDRYRSLKFIEREKKLIVGINKIKVFIINKYIRIPGNHSRYRGTWHVNHKYTYIAMWLQTWLDTVVSCTYKTEKLGVIFERWLVAQTILLFSQSLSSLFSTSTLYTYTKTRSWLTKARKRFHMYCNLFDVPRSKYTKIFVHFRTHRRSESSPRPLILYSQHLPPSKPAFFAN